MRGRQIFMESLMVHGVEHIFGNPGTTESPLLDSLIDYPSIEYIVALHEGLAVGAASFYAQASGKTAVANMHVAPGLGNAIGMIYGALKANSPLIVTAGQQDTRMRLRDPLLGHDLVAMAAPVTKWAVQVETADEMAPILRRAFKIANDGPPGPVFVGLPINVMEQESDNLPRAGEILYRQAAANPDGLEALAALALSSKKPAIIVGDDVARHGAYNQVIALAETLGAPVWTEGLLQHISFPISHAHYQGRIPLDAAAIHQLLEDRDFVLMLGGPFFEEVWFTEGPTFSDGTIVTQIENSAAQLAHNFSLDMGIVGALSTSIGGLDTLLKKSLQPTNVKMIEQRTSELNSKKQAFAEKSEKRLQALWDHSPMSPARALFELGKALPDDVIIVDESITAISDVASSFNLDKPHSFYAGRGGGIGQGLAGVIGVKVAHKDKTVVAISGDGSAMYSIQALWTAAHHDLDIVFIILSNREYRVLKHNMDVYRQRFNAQSDKPYPNMDLSNPTLGFVEMAKGMGIEGEQVSEPGAIAGAIANALNNKGSYLVDILVEGKE
ncbi:MAG: thiamine pyrophosphate-binding protein [Pseudomonadales bacterium]|nr:thiamine pyrophosphate-binding protein [Pseudomonadales bacterium]